MKKGKNNNKKNIPLKDAVKSIGTVGLWRFRHAYLNRDEGLFIISKLNVIRPSVLGDIFVEPAELERYKVKGHVRPPSRAGCPAMP